MMGCVHQETSTFLSAGYNDYQRRKLWLFHCLSTITDVSSPRHEAPTCKILNNTEDDNKKKKPRQSPHRNGEPFFRDLLLPRLYRWSVASTRPAYRTGDRMIRIDRSSCTLSCTEFRTRERSSREGKGRSMYFYNDSSIETTRMM
ncbi:uncharacterized protein V1477_004202 [Vespula maculifrons]|uniref:Uncharacterized protein n=1 Tax=Vespula maculifrons TaxID=7453 RepID=A0ABD2CQZ8_VESMC